MFVDSILNEAETKDLLRIISIQNKPVQDVLNEVKEKFVSKELLSCKALATMISSGLLNRSQRVASLVILIKNNIQMVNPFFSVLDQVFQSKDLVVESNLVVSLICDSQTPFEVMKKTVKELVEWYNRQPMFVDPPSTYTEMKEAYIKACEEIKKNSTFDGDISNVLQDNISGYIKNHSPTDSLRFEDLLEQDLQGASFKPKLLTILPLEIPMSEDELCWLLPFTSDSGQLVQGADPKSLDAAFINLIKKGTTHQYDPRDKSLLTELVLEKPEALAKGNLLTDNIINMIKKNNEEMVAFILIVIEEHNQPLFNKCLELLLEKDWEGDTSVLGVLQYLAKHFDLPQPYLEGFVVNFWKGVDKFKDDVSEYNRKVRLIVTFMKFLVLEKLLDTKAKYQIWVDLCNAHLTCHSSVSELLKLLQKEGESKSDN